MQFTLQTSEREQCIDISSQVDEALKKSDVFNGILNIYTPHATAAIIINENYDPNIQTDFLNCLNKQIPKGNWLHDKIDGNGDAHIKASILGPSETIPVKDKKPQLGQWQSPMLIELDGPRQRQIIITIIAE
jgi:secondary thiamine-phosphate synthase enzyme